MFGLFKKKTQKDKLQQQYKKLLEEAFTLSTSNRKMSDQKIYEAEQLLAQMESLD